MGSVNTTGTGARTESTKAAQPEKKSGANEKIKAVMSSAEIRRRARSIEKRRRRRTTIGVTAIVAALVVILSAQTVRLNQKNDAYKEQEAALKEELAEEKQRTKALEDEEEYVNSDEYKESVARSRLGMAYDNEIIFREE